MTGDTQLSDYIRSLFAQEDEVLEELRREIQRQGLPEIHISPEEGRFLAVLLRATKAKRVLEIGTLGGYSAIWMARALPPDGHLLTLEIDHDRAELARRFADRAGLSGIVEVRAGDAAEILPSLSAEEPFDAVFIDADKERYPTYLEEGLRLLRPGGLVLGDNALWRGRVLDDPPAEESTRAIQAFNRRLADDPEITATILDVRDGLAVAVYTPAS